MDELLEFRTLNFMINKAERMGLNHGAAFVTILKKSGEYHKAAFGKNIKAESEHEPDISVHNNSKNYYAIAASMLFEALLTGKNSGFRVRPKLGELGRKGAFIHTKDDFKVVVAFASNFVDKDILIAEAGLRYLKSYLFP
jgi:hypothetical protein